MLGAIGSAVVAILATGGLYTMQESRSARLDDELQKAVQDSTRYASVLHEREKAEAKRDTVLRSLNMIRAIDDDRYIWPHVMDEVSSALPPYTWVVSLGFSGMGQATAPITHRRRAGALWHSGRRRKAMPTQIVRDTIRIRLVGNTVDIQALTRFMKQLEVSPLLENVTLMSSMRANDNGKEVTQFQLDMLLHTPQRHRRASRSPRGLGEVTPWLSFHRIRATGTCVVLGVLAVGLAGGYWYQFWSPKNLELDEVDAHVQALRDVNQRAKAELAQGKTSEFAPRRRSSSATSTSCASSCRPRTRCRCSSSRCRRRRVASVSTSPTCSRCRSSTAISTTPTSTA